MFSKKNIKKIIIYIRNMQRKRVFFKNQKNTFCLDKYDIKKANKLGFTADEYVIFDLKHNNPQNYISEYERYTFRDLVRDYRVLLDNKIIFYSLIRNFTNTNTIYAYKQNGEYVTLEKGYEEKEIFVRLQENRRLVYKMMFEGGGKGFNLLEYQNNEYYINRKMVEIDEINELLKTDNYLLEEYCEQGKFESSLWPYSVNTIRLITIAEKNKIEVVAAIQRIGADKESCVDNASSGGLYAQIDIETGMLNSARSYSKYKLLDDKGNAIYYSKHPLTNTMIEGVKIPNWTQLLVDIKSLHRQLLYTGIEFIAWDIALLDNGFKIIEANTSCGMIFLQTFGGIRNSDLGKWMKSKEYIK